MVASTLLVGLWVFIHVIVCYISRRYILLSYFLCVIRTILTPNNFIPRSNEQPVEIFVDVEGNEICNEQIKYPNKDTRKKISIYPYEHTPHYLDDIYNHRLNSLTHQPGVPVHPIILIDIYDTTKVTIITFALTTNIPTYKLNQEQKEQLENKIKDWLHPLLEDKVIIKFFQLDTNVVM